ncbi:transcriptional regulator of NAD metabolism [Sporomusaceae bacterium BoRhaA]|uniref:transcription repressor NadR n=1 Tax=Pelorhabdus rhamnosifermentans TaxID=2772457 RepID=UPI001C061D23|nr:transcription repressor NadR [Pelorhabdus rhamnosifermentans]MBU2703259.1 transcriptional regulator of NAD metabolism [Pelorhabdus rhamnosifermentans]
MNTENRRKALLEKLCSNKMPLTGAVLAREFAVSRQVIVNDIAILRALGSDIYATPQGYLIPSVADQSLEVKIACKHNAEDLEKELVVMIEEGAQILDVIVEHPVYGEIKANLMLTNLFDVRSFVDKLATTRAEPLSLITGGVHLHTLLVRSEEQLQRIKNKLHDCSLLAK